MWLRRIRKRARRIVRAIPPMPALRRMGRLLARLFAHLDLPVGFCTIFANSSQGQFRYVVESTWGTTPGTPSMLNLRFTQANINLAKSTLVSEEIRPDGQVPFVRQGMHKVDGTIDAELSWLALKDWLAAAFRYDPAKVAFRATIKTTGAFTSTAAGSDFAFASVGKTITRTSGSNITDGAVVGMKVTIANATNSGNNGVKTLTVVTALQLTVSESLTDEAAGSSTTVTAISKSDCAVAASGKTFTRVIGSWITDGAVVGMKIRTTGFNVSGNNGLFTAVTVTATVLTVAETTFDEAAGAATAPKLNGNYIANGVKESSFSGELGLTDISQFFIYTGLKIDSCTFDAKTDAIPTVQFKVMGKDSTISTGSLGTPTDVDTSQPTDSYSGTISLGGAALLLATTLSMVATWNRKPADVVGANTAQQINVGKLKLSGKLDLFFQDEVAYNDFQNETVTSIVATFQDPAGNQIIFNIPAVKFTGAPKTVKASDPVMLGMTWEAFLDTVTGETIIINMVPAIAT